ncbi:hypothetical protein FN846DRAFT_911401 [Sphaerosporella brunnea]|uniref:Uncharacterized protein n=1 Tax=Sphaerosporella brunnea TaxID=1250544 RepID=A0A5J5EL50_9PEZI|nr:hypothetical protein FN846DRAFT_911401 [Sphaerosporella brunnea]
MRNAKAGPVQPSELLKPSDQQQKNHIPVDKSAKMTIPDKEPQRGLATLIILTLGLGLLCLCIRVFLSFILAKTDREQRNRRANPGLRAIWTDPETGSQYNVILYPERVALPEESNAATRL